MYRQFLFIVMISKSFCSDFSLIDYQMLHYAPYGSRLLISNQDPSVEFQFSQFTPQIKCSLNTSVNTYLPFRLIVATIGDKKLGPHFYKLVSCLNVIDYSWDSDDNCEFQMGIDNSTIITYSYEIYVMQCKVNSKVYAAELNLKGQTISTLVNYPEIEPNTIHAYIQEECIGCLNRNKNLPKNRFREFNSDSDIEAPLPINIVSQSCDSNDPTIRYFGCYRGSVLIFNISFVILNCFNYKFVSDHGEKRLNDFMYDAGEKIFCSIQPFATAISLYFNPTHVFLVELRATRTDVVIGPPSIVMEISEAQALNATVYFRCLTRSGPNISYFNSSKKVAMIITAYKTYIETNTKSGGLEYGIMFRCNATAYFGPAVTIAIKEENPSPPYSLAAEKFSGNKLMSTNGGYLTITEYDEPLISNNIWLIYCQNVAIGTSTPKLFKIIHPMGVTAILIYPRKKNLTFALSGFIYKCESHQLFTTTASCSLFCIYFRIVQSPKPSVWYVTLRKLLVDSTMEFQCNGYQFLNSTPPMVVNVELKAYGATIDKQTSVIAGRNISCLQISSRDNITGTFTYDIKAFFITGDKNSSVYSDVANGNDFVTIPKIPNLRVQYCCINSVNELGIFDCDPFELIEVNVVVNVKGSFFPKLRTDEDNYLDIGMFIACTFCLTYSLTTMPRACFTSNVVNILITMPNGTNFSVEGMGSAQIPTTLDNVNTDIEKYEVVVQCINYTIREVLERNLNLLSCTSRIVMLPIRKTLFRVNESIECATQSIMCREFYIFNIFIRTGSIITNNITKGLGVKFGMQHVGSSIVTCTLNSDPSKTVSRNITVDMPITSVKILNFKKIITPGESMTCEGWGIPMTTKEWYFVDGPGRLGVMGNVLTVLPDSLEGDYVYECEIQNFNNRIQQLVKFRVFNNYGWLRSPKSYDYEFLISMLIILFLFLFLFFILVGVCRNETMRKDPPMF